MLRRSLSTLATVATRAQAARAGCVANLNAPSYFSTVASSWLDQREKSDRLQHSRLAVAAAWRGEKCVRLDESSWGHGASARPENGVNASTYVRGHSSASVSVLEPVDARDRAAFRAPRAFFGPASQRSWEPTRLVFSPKPAWDLRLTRTTPPRIPPQATPPTSPRRAPTAARSPPR